MICEKCKKEIKKMMGHDKCSICGRTICAGCYDDDQRKVYRRVCPDCKIKVL